VKLAALLLALLLPASSLAVWTGERWEPWWSWSDAPTVWTGPAPALINNLGWHRVTRGVEWGEARLSGPGEAKRIRLIVVRIDPRTVRFRLDTAYRDRGRKPAWSLDRAPARALVAINAGQFPRTTPWGWVVLNGRQYQRPGFGPSSVGVGFDTEGTLHWIEPDSLPRLGFAPRFVAGFQSYPRLLANGVVPVELRDGDRGVDLIHRDARAAIGQAPDGTVLLALTRFDGAGGLLDFVPFGLTVPEMAAIMGGLGATNAVMLDGGISSQLLIREPGEERRWRGLRAVPMGLLVEAR
jgi:hypothetical protein